MKFQAKKKGRAVSIVNALGEVMPVRDGDLLAIRRARHRARPGRLVAGVAKKGGLRVVLYDEHQCPQGRPTTVPTAAVLGYWQ